MVKTLAHWQKCIVKNNVLLTDLQVLVGRILPWVLLDLLVQAVLVRLYFQLGQVAQLPLWVQAVR